MEIIIEEKNIFLKFLSEIQEREETILVIRVKKFLNPRQGVKKDNKTVCFQKCTNVPDVDFLKKKIQEIREKIVL